ncbi:MAG: mucoidy inhibitor MuiA family protein, partial [Bacteroidaceae bacterium]|nr:mucoidy inhibitor MuiA family protein [Bacteroidaceae bacterium]
KKISVNRTMKKYRDELLRLTQEKENHHKSIQTKDSRVKLVLSSPSALTDVAVTLNYIVFSASWEPFYELRADAANEPIKLVYGAHIKQSTTEDWNGVKLTISTGDPSLGNSAPDFKPMYLPGSKESKEEKKWTPPVSKLIYGTVVDKNQEPIAGASVVETDADNKTTTDSKGRFVIELEKLEHSLSFAHAGFYSDEKRAYENMHVILQENKDALNENYVDYGVSRKASCTGAVVKAMEGSVAGVNVSKSKGPTEIKYNENIPLKLSDTQTTTEFDIKVPYTIPGDGKVYDVSMLTYDIDVDYHYSTMPRASKNVYLLADLKNFSQYPLLRGNAYVYLDNIYQGECVIAPDFSADTFSVPVGKDKDIAVSRQEVKDLTSKKILGSSIKVVKCVEITVKNNKNAEVEVEVCDQYPLPKYSDIKSEVTDKGGAEIDAEKGKLTWKLKLAPQEKKVLRFSYEVKYPKTYGFTVE